MGLPPLNKKTATAVYDLLVKLGGAPDSYRNHFVQHYTGEDPSREWRFQGHLGFGGKFYLSHEKFRVGCYREDDTDDRIALIAEMNEKLEWLFQAKEA
jgi:hypothetical protein